jgi:hypothetical protein
MKPWIRIDADVFAHPKFAGIRAATFVAWVKGLGHCRQFRTDGVIDARILRAIATKGARLELIERGLWHERADGGVDVHQFAEYQLTEAQWKAKQEAGKKGANVRWGEANRIAPAVADAMAPALATASNSHATPIATDTDTEKPLSHAPRGESGQDEIWNTVAELCGFVVAGTSAHGARNKACKDLRAYNATRDSIQAVAEAYHRAHPTAQLTDTALAKHYPRFNAELKPKGRPPCDTCGVGGGHHAADCPTLRMAVVNPAELEPNGHKELPPADPASFLHDIDEEVA